MSENPENNAPPPPPSSPPPPPAGAAPPPPSTGGTGGSQDSNRTLMLVLAYLGVFALVPFFVEKEDQEVRWHAKHGLVLLAGWIILGIVFTILMQIPFLGCLSLIAYPLLMVAGLALHIVAIVKATKGERLIIPGVSQFADSF